MAASGAVHIGLEDFTFRNVVRVGKAVAIVILGVFAITIFTAITLRVGMLATKACVVGALKFDQWIDARYNLTLEDRARIRESWPYSMLNSKNPYKDVLKQQRPQSEWVSIDALGAPGAMGPAGPAGRVGPKPPDDQSESEGMRCPEGPPNRHVGIPGVEGSNCLPGPPMDEKKLRDEN